MFFCPSSKKKYETYFPHTNGYYYATYDYRPRALWGPNLNVGFPHNPSPKMGKIDLTKVAVSCLFESGTCYHKNGYPVLLADLSACWVPDPTNWVQANLYYGCTTQEQYDAWQWLDNNH